MVGVVMGYEEMCETPAFFCEPGENGLGVGRIDCGGDASGLVVDQHAIVIGSASELENIKFFHMLPIPPFLIMITGGI
jgi:hypothetical protein